MRQHRRGQPPPCVSPTTSGTNEADPFAGSVNRPSRASLRQVVRYCGATPWRRATSQTRAPGDSVSATIRALTSSGHFLRPVAPSSTSSRETRSSFDCRKVCKVFCKDELQRCANDGGHWPTAEGAQYVARSHRLRLVNKVWSMKRSPRKRGNAWLTRPPETQMSGRRSRCDPADAPAPVQVSSLIS